MPELPTYGDLPNDPDVIAPDGSEIRLLKSRDEGSSMVHALLHPGTVARAVEHRTVEEIWVCVGGRGELWRSTDESENVIALRDGVECVISLGIRFQFRASSGDCPLEIVITTTPPWPGDAEAVRCEGKWEPTI